MCGLIGVMSYADVIGEVIYGLNTLQHRGQLAAGIATLDDLFHLKKGLGLVNQVFKPEDARELTGNQALGHIRYATQGAADLINTQPYIAHHPYGIAMAHNGNITNFRDIRDYLEQRHHQHISSTCDAELLLRLFSLALQEQDLSTMDPAQIFGAIELLQEQAEGGYAGIALIRGHGMVAFCDPHGIRPMVLGVKESEAGISHLFASETKALDHLGYTVMHELEAGEAVLVDNEHHVHHAYCCRRKPAFCVFEYIYFAKEDSVLHGKPVAEERRKMGAALAENVQKAGLKPDIVVDVPSSAFFFAQGLSEGLNIPYRKALIKNNYSQRSFIAPSQQRREAIVRYKLNPIKSMLQGKKVALVDDSIVRGTTSRSIVQLVRSAGAKEVYLLSGSPPIRNPCLYGIDMTDQSEMIAAKLSLDGIRDHVGADALIYLQPEQLMSLYPDLPICSACFTGTYPTKVTGELMAALNSDKVAAGR